MEFNQKYLQSSSNEVLKIDKKLPQILVSCDKLQFFFDWWNSDIRFEKTVPHTFNEGYLKIDKIAFRTYDKEKHRNLIKNVASKVGATFRQIEQEFIEFMNKGTSITLYFKFLDENRMLVKTFDIDGNLMSQATMSFGEGEPEKEIHPQEVAMSEDFEAGMKEMNFQNIALLITSLWYIATTKKTTKYVYEQKTPLITGRHKDVVKVSDTKYITTPIYDMNKVRVVKVESLMARKKGWTYSHAFQVHGHYRHYKSGKVVFINSFVKGKNKEFKAQTTVLDPK